jgi:hypothetical protein
MYEGLLMINTAFASPWASNVTVPVRVKKSEVEYTPALKVVPPRAGLISVAVRRDASAIAAPESVIAETYELLLDRCPGFWEPSTTVPAPFIIAASA